MTSSNGDDLGTEPEGDPARIWEKAHQLYYKPLVAWLRREAERHELTIGWVDVEDIAQDTFESALDHQQQIRSPRAWLYAVARRKLLRHLPEASKRATDPLDEAAEAIATWHSTAVVADAELRLDVQRIFDAMRELTSDKQRVAVYAHHVLGYTSQEVADLLGCEVATARVHAHRGAVSLRATVYRRTWTWGSGDAIAVGSGRGRRFLLVLARLAPLEVFALLVAIRGFAALKGLVFILAFYACLIVGIAVLVFLWVLCAIALDQFREWRWRVRKGRDE